MTSIFFVLRLAVVWIVTTGILLSMVVHAFPSWARWIFPAIMMATLIFAIVRAFSHLRRVRLIAERFDSAALGNRHRRQIDVPFTGDEAFEMIDAAIRELPYVDSVESARDSLQVRARVRRMSPYLHGAKGPRPMAGPSGARRNLVFATVTPGDAVSTITLVCEPEGGAALDWFMVDDGTNLENIQAIARAISRRAAEKRKGERAEARETATEKELTVAKLSLLHAQVEPHFLYNTLASAQVLTRSDPAKADQMLGYLIDYLRRSLPRTEDSLSTVGDELERAQAYLEILKIRMGERLAVQVQVPEHLKSVPMPPMMLQTLVENAIKHGLEPVVGGGTIWIIAREIDGKVAITVADDGRGFSEAGGGTGIGLKNIRERLRLAYGDAASFAIVANFPKGVAATITLPQ